MFYLRASFLIFYDLWVSGVSPILFLVTTPQIVFVWILKQKLIAWIWTWCAPRSHFIYELSYIYLWVSRGFTVSIFGSNCNTSACFCMNLKQKVDWLHEFEPALLLLQHTIEWLGNWQWWMSSHTHIATQLWGRGDNLDAFVTLCCCRVADLLLSIHFLVFHAR